jgi:hypothetical protein
MDLRERLSSTSLTTVAAALPAGSALVEYVRVMSPDLAAGF